ncbi:hypothetical protein ACWC5I_04900 [Kitasatospora sp. NPDC001574]
MAEWDAERQQWVTGPPALPQDTPEPSPDAARPRPVLLAAAAVVLCAALAGGGWLLLHRGSGNRPSTAAPSNGPAGLPGYSTPASAAGPNPTPAAKQPPPTPTGGPTQSFNLVQDPAGFTLAVPQGWQRSGDGNSVLYKSADGARVVQVITMAERTPYAGASATDVDMARNTVRYPGYRRIRLEETADGAELEYSYDTAEHGTRRAVDHALTASDGTVYALLVAGPPNEWPALQHIHRTVLSSFCLTRHCPAASG